MIPCFADDLKIAFDCVLSHADQVRIATVECVDVSLASFD